MRMGLGCPLLMPQQVCKNQRHYNGSITFYNKLRGMDI